MSMRKCRNAAGVGAPDVVKATCPVRGALGGNPLLRGNRAPSFDSIRFTALQSRPIEFLDFTSVTLEEFQQLVPPFETAFQCRMAVWRLDGKPRTTRRFTVYKTCPLV